MKTYKIQATELKAFAIELKTIEPIENIRAAFSQQPDGSALYYAKSQAEITVCEKHGQPA
jgi:hypothetical protein